MPANELLVNLARDGLEVALASLLEQEREEVDLEEEVTQLAAQRLVIFRERGVGDLVCLLDRVRDDRPLGLLAIPGALPPQLPGQVLEVEKRLREAHDGNLLGGGVGGRVRERGRLVAGRVADLALVVLLEVLDPRLHLLIALLLEECRPDRRPDLVE